VSSKDTNFKLIIEYDGSCYHGWQRQARERTIQGTIEGAIARLTGEKVSLLGSGRTDAGVHALGQVANFRSASALSAEVVLRALNALLPDDIVVLDCSIVPAGFHARFDAREKTYCYSLLNRPSPAAVGRQYHWHIRHPLNVPAMQAALTHLTGKHDFTSFQGAGSPRPHSIRSLTAAHIELPGDGRIDITVSANGFLKHMVRNIVGTLVAVGRGRIAAGDVPAIIEARDRAAAPATAPACGLCLMGVRY
jgi:tRNA pseudouridine38-40 synthase